MKYLTYSGNHLINAKLPDNSEIYYPQPAKPGVSRAEIPEPAQKGRGKSTRDVSVKRARQRKQ